MRINDRQEVAFKVTPKFDSTVVYVWKSSQLKQAYVGVRSCPTVVAFNNRGVMGIQSQCALHPFGFILASPFGADMSNSGRFAGQPCPSGISSSLVNLADDNDYLLSTSGSSFIPATRAIHAAGCLDLGAKFEDYGVGWGSIGAGLVGGGRFTGTPFSVGAITDGSAIAAMNDLLDDASRAEWRVLYISRILADGTMIAQAIALSDSRVVAVKLKRAG
jgi:hypothetical protein